MFNNKRKKVDLASIVFQGSKSRIPEGAPTPVFPRKKGISKSFIALLSVIFLGAIAAYFLYNRGDEEGNVLSAAETIKPNNTAYTQRQEESISQRDSLLSGINRSETNLKNDTNSYSASYINLGDSSGEQAKDNSKNEIAGTSSYVHSNNSNTLKKESKEPAIVKIQYKVPSKAFFYSQPNQKFRRSNFINHWKNSYTPLNALDEKNGFIYVVFTNKRGKTSEGWLRKKDTKAVKSIMYASGGK